MSINYSYDYKKIQFEGKIMTVLCENINIVRLDNELSYEWLVYTDKNLVYYLFTFAQMLH